MRRFQLGLAAAALPVLVFTLFLAGCSKDDKSKTDTSGAQKEEKQQEASGPAKLLEPKGGVLKGKITLTASPAVDDLNKGMRDAINAKPDQKDFCLSAKDDSEKSEQVYRVGGPDNKQLGNVFIWVKPVAGTLFKVDEKQLKEAKENPVVIHQPHCAFIPHSAIVFAEYHPDPNNPAAKKQTGQYILVKNDAPNSHNTKYEAGPKNPNGNPTLQSKEERKIEDLKADSAVMKFTCGIHPWMDAYIRLLDTPYFAISHSDTLDGDQKVKKDDKAFGTYEIKNLPVGTKVQVFAWHERIGFLNAGGGSKGDIVEIKEGAPTEKNYEVAPK